jgi:hypothetical protein
MWTRSNRKKALAKGAPLLFTTVVHPYIRSLRLSTLSLRDKFCHSTRRPSRAVGAAPSAASWRP